MPERSRRPERAAAHPATGPDERPVTAALGNSVVARLLGPASTATSGLSDDVASGVAAARGGGKPLAGSLREEMQESFGADFSAVRVHDDRPAARLSGALGAAAFTTGSDIFLGDPAAGRDRELMAHELTHVVQQNGAAAAAPSGVSDPGDTAEAEARHLGRLIATVGGAAGNSAVTQRLGGSVLHRSPGQATTPDEVKQMRGFAGLADGEKLRLMNVLLDQFWVGPSDEEALERIWNSFTEDQFVAFTDGHPGKFDECVDRGADLYDVCFPYQDVKKHFSADLEALARHYLSVNEQVVKQELDAVGAGAPPGAQQTDRIAELQEVAAVLANLQRAQEAARSVAVGWRTGDGGEVEADLTGRKMKFRALFRPGQPPPLTEEPEDLPSGDIFGYPTGDYGQIQAAYEATAAQIVALVDAYPGLYGMVRDGTSRKTADFVTTADPAAAREKMSEPLRHALQDIAATRANLGNDLNPLDLEPLVQQLFAGSAAIGGTKWVGGIRHRAALNELVGHNISKAFKRALLQEVQILALLCAPFTSGASLLLVLGVSAGAAGIQALGSHRDATVLGQAEGASVKPGTELVTPGTAAHAKMLADADLIAFGLAVLAFGAAGIAQWRAGRPAPKIELFHGTDAAGGAGMRGPQGGRISVTHTGGAHQDLGQGFYLTLDEETANVYAMRRAAQRGGGGTPEVLKFEVPRSDLGVVADIRPGGNLHAQWEAYLAEPPHLPGGMKPLPGMETNRALLRLNPEQRGVFFDEFLTRNGMQRADTIIAPLGDSVFTGITSPKGVTSQICIRSQAVADKLNAQISPAAPATTGAR